MARNKSGASHVAGATGGGASASGGHGHARTKSSRTLTRGANGGSAFRLGTLTATNSVARLIDLFLADAKAMGDRVPSDDELVRARHFLKHLEASTREDHLKSVDEVLSHAPRELLLKTKQLQEAEQFVLLAAADDVQKLQRKLDNDWELVNATDVRVIELMEVCTVESACSPRRCLLSAQRDGHTALHAAAACNCLAAVELLIKRGAHVTLQDVRMLALRVWLRSPCGGLTLHVVLVPVRRLPAAALGCRKRRPRGRRIACIAYRRHGSTHSRTCGALQPAVVSSSLGVVLPNQAGLSVADLLARLIPDRRKDWQEKLDSAQAQKEAMAQAAAAKKRLFAGVSTRRRGSGSRH